MLRYLKLPFIIKSLFCLILSGRLRQVLLYLHVLMRMHLLSKGRAYSSNFGKRPLAKIRKKLINLTSKLGEINDIEHNKGSKIYPQNQVILDCITTSIPLKHKFLMGHCFS